MALPDEPEVPSGSRAAAEGARRVEAIERRRIPQEDWQTLFRQMRTLAEQLASQPFVRDDLEAATLLDRALVAPDLEEFDRRIDALAEYVEARLRYEAEVKAAQTGRPVEDTPRLRATAPAAPGMTRLAAAAGPSGSDFDLGGDAASPDRPAPRRGVLRL